MKFGEVRDALEDGATTASEIAESLSLDRSHTSRELRKLAEDDDTPLERTRLEDGTYWYYRTDTDGDADASELPVVGDRDYDWQSLVPSPDSVDYVEARGELTEIASLIDAREETGQLARFRVSGPPGTGKTTLAEDVAAQRRDPYFEVQLTSSMRGSDLIGAPKLIGQETFWADGPITRALLCSQERETVLVLDEVNRANPKAKSNLMPVLDHRGRVRIKARGDEVVQGDPMNLIVVSTMNEGADFQTFDLDPAEKRRLGNRWDIPYLGLEDVDAEAELVSRDAPVDEDLARFLVVGANSVRKRAANPDDRVITKGIAASELVRWAQTYAAFDEAGFANPLSRAAESAVIQSVYDDPEAAAEVRDILQDAIGDLKVVS